MAGGPVSGEAPELESLRLRACNRRLRSVAIVRRNAATVYFFDSHKGVNVRLLRPKVGQFLDLDRMHGFQPPKA